MIRKSDVLHTVIFAGCVALGIVATQHFTQTGDATDPSYQLLESIAQSDHGRHFSMRGFMGIGFGLAGWVVLMLLYLMALRVIDFILARVRPAEPVDVPPDPADDTEEEDDDSFTIEDGKDD